MAAGSSDLNAEIKNFTKLSYPTHYQLRGSDAVVISLPKGMKVVNEQLVLTERVPTIAVVDTFMRNSLYRIGWGIYAPHGVLVTKYAVRGFEDKVGVLAIEVLIGTGCSLDASSKAISEALDLLLTVQRQYHNIMALNLSIGACIRYYNISRGLRTAVTHKNVETIGKARILSWIQKCGDPRSPGLLQPIEYVNRLAAEDIEVYSAAGNTKVFGINTFSLANIQHIVTAHDYRNAITAFSTEAAAAIHSFQGVYDDEGRLASITDGLITLEASEIVMKKSRIQRLLRRFTGARRHIGNAKGTSYASPIKLNEDLRAGRLQPYAYVKRFLHPYG